jgi:nucleoside-diphosphate-sugar epimerase
MKILITGGTGFIGSRLAIRSKAMNHEVIILGQDNTEAEKQNLEALRKSGIDIILGAVTDKDVVKNAVMGCELVVHLAAAQHEANVPDEHFRNVNVFGTRNLVEASIEARVARFIHGSTIGIYGAALDGTLDEETEPRPDNIYGVTKAEAEQVLLSYKDDIPITIIRISETYGPGDRRLLKLFRAINKGKFFMIGDGQNLHQLIYVDDLIDGMYKTLETDAAVGEVFVLAGNEKLTTQEMVYTIADALGVKRPGLRAPLWIFMLAAVILEFTMKPFGIQPPLHRRRMNFFIKSFYFSQDKARDLLQFTPKTSFSDGALETAHWYSENNVL